MIKYENYSRCPQIFNEVLPSHWTITPMYGLAKEKKISDCADLELLSVYLDLGVIPFSQKAEKRTNVTSTDLSKYQRVDPGDFVLNNQQAWRGSVGVSRYTGIVSPAYIVLEMDDRNNSEFMNYMLRSHTMVDQYVINSKSVGSIQRNIHWISLKRTYVPVPPRVEQDQIVRFLDWKVSEINKLIGIRRKEIQELEELKSAVITAAITKGLDPNAAMKKTDVYYLPEVPAAWEVTKLKRICKVGASINEQLKKHDDQDEVVFLPMENISEDGQIDCSIKQPIANVKTGFSSFAKDDVIVAKITPCFENGKGACLDKLESDIGYGTTELFNLRAGDDVLPEYLYFITMTKLFRILGEGQMTGSAGQKRVPADFIRDFTIGRPSIEEQQQIVDYIHAEKERIDRLIATKHEQLQALTEFKSTVISDVVTGKIDVRGIAVPQYEHFDDIAEDDSEDVKKETDGEEE